MTTKPILFSAPMVNAIMNGQKSQTRRIAKSDKPPHQKGDQLWVKETWQSIEQGLTAEYLNAVYLDTKPSLLDRSKCGIAYRASVLDRAEQIKWRSPLFMMQWMSRIRLEVTDIYKEELFEIYKNPEDAVAEGIERVEIARWKDYLEKGTSTPHPVGSFKTLWESLHGRGSWTNKEVWVIKFNTVIR